MRVLVFIVAASELLFVLGGVWMVAAVRRAMKKFAAYVETLPSAEFGQPVRAKAEIGQVLIPGIVVHGVGILGMIVGTALVFWEGVQGQSVVMKMLFFSAVGLFVIPPVGVLVFAFLSKRRRSEMDETMAVSRGLWRGEHREPAQDNE